MTGDNLREIKGIDFNAHYYVLMHPLEAHPVPPYGYIVSTSSDSREKWVECVITENDNRLDDGYKVTLSSLEEGYGREKFYIEDFISKVQKGYIVKKVPGLECVEKSWDEPIGGNATLHHTAYVLMMTKEK